MISFGQIFAINQQDFGGYIHCPKCKINDTAICTYTPLQTLAHTSIRSAGEIKRRPYLGASRGVRVRDENFCSSKVPQSRAYKAPRANKPAPTAPATAKGPAVTVAMAQLGEEVDEGV